VRLLTTAVLTTLLATALSGCAYRPLKAPCSAEEGETALGYAEPTQAPAAEALRAIDRCGPMRPI
jgi:hypothetical protein